VVVEVEEGVAVVGVGVVEGEVEVEAVVEGVVVEVEFPSNLMDPILLRCARVGGWGGGWIFAMYVGLRRYDM
jgi:hypothetical protein